MPLLRSVLCDAWRALPLVVAESRLTSADGGPNSTALEYILPDLFKAEIVEGFRPTRPQLKAAGSRHVSDGEAREIRRALVGHGMSLAAIAEWYDLSWVANRRAGLGVKADKLAEPAKNLAVSHPLPSQLDSGDRLRLAAAELGKHASSQRGLTAEAISRELKVNEAKYVALLNEVWSAGTKREVSPPTAGATIGTFGISFAGACGFGKAVPTATPLAESLWLEWLASNASTDRVDLELSRGDRSRRPVLIGPVNRPRGSTADDFIMPLDMAVNARLSRSLRDPESEWAPTLPADLAISATIQWSAMPLGLPTEWARAILTLGFEVASRVYGDSSLLDPEAPSPPPGYSGGALTMAERWRWSGLSALGRGARADNPLLAAPHGRYLARLWIRVFRRALVAESEPSATEVWAHIYGAFKSIMDETKRLGGDPEGPLHEGIAPEPPPRPGEDWDPTATAVQVLLDLDAQPWDEMQMAEAREVLGEMGPLLEKFQSDVLSLGALGAPNPRDVALFRELTRRWCAGVAEHNRRIGELFASQGKRDPYAHVDIQFEIALMLIRANARNECKAE